MPKKRTDLSKPEVTANLPAIVDMELFLQTNTDPSERYQAIDGHVRGWYRTIMAWPYIARYCELVENEKLYEHGGFKNMTAWLQNAAPKSERSIRDYLSIHKNLSSDYSDAEQSEMPVETAKFLAKNVTSREHRKNPKVRAASKKEKAECVKEVREAIPDLHLEDIENVVFTASQIEAIDRVCAYYREKEDDPDMSRQDCLEGICVDYQMLRERIDTIETVEEVGA